MARYGNIYALSDFVTKLLPQRLGPRDISFANEVLIGLKRIDVVQQQNNLVTYTISTGGGIGVTHAGQRCLLMIPAQQWIRVLTDAPGGKLAKVMDKAARDPACAKDTTIPSEYRQWNVYKKGLNFLWQFIETLPKPNAEEVKKRIREHRYFPGPVRQAALEAFQRGGLICQGVAMRGREIRPHKVKPSEKIEFDHILPYSLGGSRGPMNIQVLCEQCNRIKGATAY